MKNPFAHIAVATLIAACGGSQPPIGAPGAISNPAGSFASRDRRLQDSGSYGDLIYVATSKRIDYLSYPQGTIIGSLPYEEASLCADPNNGNVFVLSGKIVEYAHAGTSPVATLDLPSGYADPHGCSVDPTTGNLAVLAFDSQWGVLVYSQAQGAPTFYALPDTSGAYYAAYDDSGDLYVLVREQDNGDAVASLPMGQTQFELVKIKHLASYAGEKIQWDGTYLSMKSAINSTIFQLQISGTTGTVAGETGLNLGTNDYAYTLENGSVISPYYKIRPHNDQALAVWQYPSGGDPTAKYYGITKGRKSLIYDVTFSVASSR